MTKTNPHHPPRLRGISRHRFLKAATAASLLAGCRAVEQPFGPPLDTPTPASATPLPTSMPAPPPAAAVSPQADISKMYPHAPGKVVHTRYVGVWNGDNLSPEAIRQMLDASITELTGLNDVTETWADGYVISAQSSYPDIAWQWIIFLSQQMPDRMMPARRSLVESPAYEQKLGREIVEVIRVALENSVLPSPGVTSEFGGALDIFGRAVTRVVNGQAAPLEAMTQAQKEAEAKREP